MRSIVTGTGNTAVGAATQYSITDGSNNCAVGAYAQYTISNGSNNCALGRSAQNSLSTGYDNTSVGYSSQRNLYKGYGNTTSGARAASYLADGVSAATDFSRCVYLGQDTRVSGNGAENEIAIGSFAVGLGSNTAVIGTSSITMTKLFGDINLDKTITAVGAVGAQTINKTIGSVNFAAGATSLTVTNNRVTAASVIHLSVASNDATMKTVSHTKVGAGAPTPPPIWGIGWQVAADVEEVQAPTEDELLQARINDAVGMFAPNYQALVRAFILATDIFPIKKDVANWQGAFKDQIARTGLSPEDVTEACKLQRKDHLTLKDPHSIMNKIADIRAERKTKQAEKSTQPTEIDTPFARALAKRELRKESAIS